MNKDRKRCVIDMDDLKFDWLNQRVRINEHISRRSAVFAGIWNWKIITVIMCALFIVIASLFLVNRAMIDEIYEDQYYAEMEEDYIPESLYVLNGYTDESEFEENLDLIVPINNGREEL